MIDAFRIYVDQLREGKEEVLQEDFSPEFLAVSETDLSFKDPVKVTGTVYQADDELVLNLNIDTLATIACSICNAPVKVDISIQNFYHAEPLKDIKTGIYDFRDLLRETIILETPKFAECNGDCPEREKVRKYFKKLPEEGAPSPEDEGYRPFSDLDNWDKNK